MQADRKGREAPLTAEEIAKLDDRDIDVSDIPELGEDFRRSARRVDPDSEERGASD